MRSFPDSPSVDSYTRKMETNGENTQKRPRFLGFRFGRQETREPPSFPFQSFLQTSKGSRHTKRETGNLLPPQPSAPQSW